MNDDDSAALHHQCELDQQEQDEILGNDPDYHKWLDSLNGE